MEQQQDFNKVSVLIIGAGVAGLSAGIAIKKRCPQLSICVLEKALSPGYHNLSGAVIETHSLNELLDSVDPKLRQSSDYEDLIGRKVENDQLLFLTKKHSLNISSVIKIAKLIGHPLSRMDHQGDSILSISKLTKWLSKIAIEIGVEVMTSFAVADVSVDTMGKIVSVKLKDQGIGREGQKKSNYLEGEVIHADYFILAEGADGFITEKFIDAAGLKREREQLYSLGIKELIKVKPDCYEIFGNNTAIHFLGYPLWQPVFGPGIFGGAFMYSAGHNCIALGIIAGADWKEYDFNPEDALTLFKEHPYVKKLITGCSVLEAGAKLIPEGGYYALPRGFAGHFGSKNAVILGDALGLVNMQKIKGIHCSIESGLVAASAISDCFNDQNSDSFAANYTARLEDSDSIKEMFLARNFRQCISRFGNLFGFPLSSLSGLIPRKISNLFFRIEPDYKTMRNVQFKLKKDLTRPFDKDAFVAKAGVEHNEDQPPHCVIHDPIICRDKCKKNFSQACITFCPGGVYDELDGLVHPVNFINCLHCKTCQRKCPYANVKWMPLEGGGGPRYRDM